MKNNIKIQKEEKGFTLIEMLVSISLFSVVLVIILGAMLTIIDVNRKAQALASVINNFNASVESMNRVIKSAEPDSIQITDNNTRLKLTINNAYGLVGPQASMSGDVDVVFRFNEEDGRIERSLNNGSSFLSITSQDVTIQRLRFLEVGSLQPEIIIIMAGEAGVSEISKTTFDIMTTVSQRQLDTY